MKIYSSRNTDKFDKYVGKDVWVNLRTAADHTYFYRFLDKDADGNYICNYIIDYWAYNPKFWAALIKEAITKPRYVTPRRLEIIVPVEVYTTEELFGNILKED